MSLFKQLNENLLKQGKQIIYKHQQAVSKEAIKNACGVGRCGVRLEVMTISMPGLGKGLPRDPLIADHHGGTIVSIGHG